MKHILAVIIMICMVVRGNAQEQVEIYDLNAEDRFVLWCYLMGQIPNVRLNTTGNPFKDKRQQQEYSDAFQANATRKFGHLNHETIVFTLTGVPVVMGEVWGSLKGQSLCLPTAPNATAGTWFNLNAESGGARCNGRVPDGRAPVAVTFRNEAEGEWFFEATRGGYLTAITTSGNCRREGYHLACHLSTIYLRKDNVPLVRLELIRDGGYGARWSIERE